MDREREIVDGSGTGLTRRELLVGSSATALVAALHDFAAEAAVPRAGAGSGSSALLAQLELVTAATPAVLESFYGEALGLPTARSADGALEVRAGESRLRFRFEAAAAGAFYHFAFNIPEGRILEAREWLGSRARIIPPYEHLRDSRYPPDVVHFRHWNAHSLFFWDPAGNLAELIARHDLPDAAAGPFGPGDLRSASEIGLVVSDVVAVARGLGDAFGLAPYRQASAAFTALGDENGLLLVMRGGRRLGFDEGKPSGVFPTRVTLRARGGEHSVPEHPYRLAAEPAR